MARPGPLQGRLRPKQETVSQIANKPIFRVTSLKKEIVQVYSCLGGGFCLGLFVGFMAWHG